MDGIPVLLPLPEIKIYALLLPLPSTVCLYRCPTTDNTMYMRMEGQLLSPCVQHCYYSRLCTQMLFILCELHQIGSRRDIIKFPATTRLHKIYRAPDNTHPDQYRRIYSSLNLPHTDSF